MPELLDLRGELPSESAPHGAPDAADLRRAASMQCEWHGAASPGTYSPSSEADTKQDLAALRSQYMQGYKYGVHHIGEGDTEARMSPGKLYSYDGLRALQRCVVLPSSVIEPFCFLTSETSALVAVTEHAKCGLHPRSAVASLCQVLETRPHVLHWF